MKIDALVVAFSFLALSTAAKAEPVPPTTPPTPTTQMQKEDEVADSFVLQLNLFREDATLSLSKASIATNGVPGQLLFIEPLAVAGYQWDQNALLLGLGVLFQGNTTVLSLSPTYRRYFTPLRAGHFSPLVEGAVDLTTFNPGVPGASLTWGLGLTVGAGGEWLFIRNLGIIVKVDLAYGHMELTQPISNFGTLKFDSFSIGGIAGIVAHI